MANPRRIERLQQLILETAATHVQRELDDPRIGLISITRVKLSPDLSHAVLYWSSLGDEAARRTTARGLEHALPSIQRAIAHAMQTRVTPRCELHYDEGLEKAQRMEEIFTRLRAERGEIPSLEDEADAPGEDAADAEEGAGGAPRAADES